MKKGDLVTAVHFTEPPYALIWDGVDPTSSSRIGKWHPGEIGVVLKDKKDEMVNVMVNEIIGYVSSAYLRRLETNKTNI